MIAKVEATTPTVSVNESQLTQIIERAGRLEDSGDLDGAVSCYEEALLAGFATVEVCYNLAILYKQQLLYEDALTLLQRCLDSPEYSASAHYASGECQLALGNLVAAGEHFDRAVSRLALDRIPPEQVSEVSHVLQVAIDTFTSLDDQERSEALQKTLNDFLAAHGRTPPSRPLVPRSSPAPQASSAPAQHEAPAAEEGTPVISESGARMVEQVTHRTPNRGSTTGRLRANQRRLTGQLDSSALNTRQGVGSGLLNRLTTTRRLEDLLPSDDNLGPRSVTPQFARRPVNIKATAPLPGESALPAEIRLLLSRSAEDFAQGHFEAVIDDCNQVISLDPNYLPVQLRLAEAYARQGRIVEATAKCERLIDLYGRLGQESEALLIHRLLGAIDPTNLKARITMADLYFARPAGEGTDLSEDVRALVEEAERQGADDIALEYAEKLIRYSPDHPTAMRLTARLHLRAGNAHRALAHCQALLRRDRNDVTAVSGANIALTLIENTVHWPSLETLAANLRNRDAAARDECLDLYASTINSLDPARRANLQVAAGLLALTCGLPRRAVAFLEELRQANIGTQAMKPAVRFSIAYGLKQAYAALNDGPAERQWLQHAAELMRDERVRAFIESTRLFGEPISVGMLHVATAESLIRAGKHDNAIIVLEAAKADLPDDATIRRRLAQLYHEAGRLGQALDELDALSTAQLNAGRLDAMIETLHQMSALAGENLTVKAHLVERYLKRGCPDEALLELDAIAAIHVRAGRPDDAAEALRQAADTAWMIGQHDRGLALYDRVLELAPENVTLRQAYINCLLQGGKQKEAADQQRAIARRFWDQRRVQETIAALHQVIVLDPRDVESYSLLGEALASVGEYAQAERVYRRLVRLTPDDPIAKAKQTAMAMLAREQQA
jgi:tetratricopeptide (TPR) repeat protein